MKASSSPQTVRPRTSRNPARTQQRILEAAFKEFAEKGFAGARVDEIARSAGVNKRMLYHYFGAKEALFREVLRRKMAERKVWGDATPNEAAKSVPYWFELACQDVNWIRLLEWEALEFGEKRLIDEDRRRKSLSEAVARIQARQKSGHLSAEFSAEDTLLAMVALAWFPVAFPQLTRLITGQTAAHASFQTRQKEFLSKFARAFESLEGSASLISKSPGELSRKLKLT